MAFIPLVLVMVSFMLVLLPVTTTSNKHNGVQLATNRCFHSSKSTSSSSGQKATCCFNAGTIYLDRTCNTVTPFFLKIRSIPFNMTFDGYCETSDLEVYFSRILNSNQADFRVAFSGWGNTQSQLDQNVDRIRNMWGYQSVTSGGYCGTWKNYWISLDANNEFRAGVNGKELKPLHLVENTNTPPTKNRALHVTFGSWWDKLHVKNFKVQDRKMKVFYSPNLQCESMGC